MEYLLMLPLALFPLSLLMSAQGDSAGQIPHRDLARRIVKSLQPERGERAILRFDPETMPELEPEVRKLLEQAGATVETIAYGAAPDFEKKLNQTDIYIWLPAGPRAVTPPDQVALLVKWLDEGRGRQIHFHWGDGTRATDGLNGEHSAVYDRVYIDALDIDYAALDKKMDAAISILKSGEARVTTPAGTDIRFRVGDRPFCKQNGDATKANMAKAKTRIDREVELPAGVLRVAPLEDSVSGTIVIPWARIDKTEIKNIRLEFERGVLKRASSADNEDVLRRYLDSGPGLSRFREFALGLNPKLATPKAQRWLAYYGYGAGIIRLALGDNSELGGAARGLPVRWFFFEDATVRAGDKALVEKGRLAF